MPLEMIASQPGTLDLPWLRELDIPQANLCLSKVSVPIGASVYVDVARQRFSMLRPGSAMVWAFEGQRCLRVLPNVDWTVQWVGLDQVNTPNFGFMVEDGEYAIISDYMKGREALLAEFASMMLDTQLNPLGFPVPDGAYKSTDGIAFDVAFGRDGSPPFLRPVPRGPRPDVKLPSKFMVAFDAGTTISERQTNAAIVPTTIVYECHVRSYVPLTGEVSNLRCRVPGTLEGFHTTGAELERVLVAGTARIVKILEEKRPEF